MKFSQRIGKTEARTLIQKDEMDEALKNKLYNLVLEIIRSKFTVSEGFLYVKKDFLAQYCDYFALKRTDFDGLFSHFQKQLNHRIYVNNDIWFLYDLIEWLISLEFYKYELYLKDFNRILAEEKSAYRLGEDGEMLAITDEMELGSLDEAVEKTSEYPSVSAHLKGARLEFSKREKPNYKNVVRESILAVETLAKIISNDKNATLETAIKKIPNLNLNLKDSLIKLYHFRGDEGGLMHGSKEGQETYIDENDARFIMILAHSLVNYLITKFLIK